MPEYTITIGFKTDRPLTEDELARISGAAQAQVSEPADEWGDDVGDLTVDDVQLTALRVDAGWVNSPVVS